VLRSSQSYLVKQAANVNSRLPPPYSPIRSSVRDNPRAESSEALRRNYPNTKDYQGVTHTKTDELLKTPFRPYGGAGGQQKLGQVDAQN
jgi:hypothetical protein